MTQTQHKAAESSGNEPRMNRRAFMKTVGVTAGAATVGAGSMQSDRLSPVGEVEAIAPVVAGIIVGAAAGGVVGGAAGYWLADGGDFDEDDLTEDRIYNAAMGVIQGREDMEDELRHDYDVSNDQDTPFGKAAWHTIRTQTTSTLAAGETVGEATSNSQTALDEQLLRGYANQVEIRNTQMNALVEEIVIQWEEFGQARFDDGGDGPLVMEATFSGDSEPIEARQPSDEDVPEGIEPVEASAVSEGYLLWYTPEMSSYFHADYEDIGREADIREIGYFTDHGFTTAVTSRLEGNLFEMNLFEGIDGQHHGRMASEELVNPETGDRLEDFILGFTLRDVIWSIYNAYDEIRGDISTYVDTINDQLEQGVIDPADILGPYDIVEAFAHSDESSFMGAQLLATGAEMPDNIGYEALISHPDLAAEELWGTLYPRFSGEPKALSPGMTLQPEDYGMAYFGFHSHLDGEWTTTILSGDEPLEILDVTGLDDEMDIIGGDALVAERTAGENGRVVLHEGDDPPDPIRYPADHENWQVVIEGNVNNDQIPVSEVESEDVDGTTEWYVEPTTLADGETVEHTRLLSAVEYEQTFDYVSDPTDVNAEETIARIEATMDKFEELEEALDSSPISGGIFDGWTPPGLEWIDENFPGGRAGAAATGGGLAFLAFWR